MKQSLQYGVIATIAAALIFMPACKKVRDYIAHNPPLEVKLCSIEKIKLDVFGEKNELAVNYNEQEDPVSVLHTKQNVFSNVDQRFRYDKQNRLTDYITNFSGNTGVLQWHTYTYKNKNTVIDTVYNYEGKITDDLPPYSATDFRVWVYELDVWGRIIKSIEYNQTSPEPAVVNYVYNMQGNLLKQGAEYDNKVNIYRTNKVWMFIAKDYSMNNALSTADETIKIKDYNAAGLPLEYKALPANEGIGTLMNLNYEQLQVEYNCGNLHNN